MATTAKLTTGLTGLKVAKNPHHTLGILYNKLLRTLHKMPEDAAYRKHTEAIVHERLGILNNSKDIEKVERSICCGQIEEVIVQAENELVLARKMLTWRPWEPLMKAAPATQWTWPPAK